MKYILSILLFAVLDCKGKSVHIEVKGGKGNKVSVTNNNDTIILDNVSDTVINR